MAESLWLSVAIVVDRSFLLLRSIVPGELEQTFPLSHGILGILLHFGVSCRVSQEIEIEACILVLGGS